MSEADEEKKENIEESKPEEAAEKTQAEPQAEEKKPEEAKVEEAPTPSEAPKAAEEKPAAAEEAPKAAAEVPPAKETQEKKGKYGKQGGKRFGGERNRRPVEVDPDKPAFVEQVISINRITKVTKGGKKLSFSALVVVGDTKGNVGYSLSKAREVATAIRKAMTVAKKSMIAVPMRGSTIPHEIIGECSGARVLLKPASEGTGVIASGPVRAVCDGAGIHNILTKCHRSNNPINVVKATIEGLGRLKSVEPVAKAETAEPEEAVAA